MYLFISIMPFYLYFINIQFLFFESNKTLNLIHINKITIVLPGTTMVAEAERGTLYVDDQIRNIEMSKLVKKGSQYETIKYFTPGRYAYDVIPTKDLGKYKTRLEPNYTDYVIILYSYIRGVTVTKENGETLKLLQQ